MSWGIAFKPNPDQPITQGGRTLARYETFPTQEQCEAFIASQGQSEFLQAVETDGIPKPAFSGDAA